MIEVQASDESGLGWPWLSLAIWSSLAKEVLILLGVPGPMELSVAFVDEERISELNELYRGKQGPTDVLSFPMDDLCDLGLELSPASSPGGASTSGASPSGASPSGASKGPLDGPVLLGDVVIAPAVAARQAVEHFWAPHQETALLLVHGILHLLGMDHEDPDEAREMEAKEDEILEELYHSQLWVGWSSSLA